MGLETGNYINDLTITNPTSSDPKSQGDDHIRLLKTVLKECLNGFTGAILVRGTETGTASAHVLTPTTALVGYTTGLMLLYSPSNSGTGALTVNVSGLGAKSIKTIMGADPSSGDVTANQPILVVYDGTNFVLLAGSTFLNKTGNQTLTGNFSVTGTSSVAGAATFGDTLSVAGASTFTGDIGGTGGDKKANLDSPTFTGTVTVPTPLVAGAAVNKSYADALSMASGNMPPGGTVGQVSVKQSSTNYDTAWDYYPAASQSDMETGTDVTKMVTPGCAQYHPSAAKFWIKCNYSGTIQASYNVTSITDDGVGLTTITIGTDFSSANWCGAGTTLVSAGSGYYVNLKAQAAGSCQVFTGGPAAAGDADSLFFVGYGDQ